MVGIGTFMISDQSTSTVSVLACFMPFNWVCSTILMRIRFCKVLFRLDNLLEFRDVFRSIVATFLLLPLGGPYSDETIYLDFTSYSCNLDCFLFGIPVRLGLHLRVSLFLIPCLVCKSSRTDSAQKHKMLTILGEYYSLT
jgi:hypothetical protein